jgi:DNA polymerase-1
MGKRVVLIDGSALIFRAYYAIPNTFRTSHGLPTNAIYGFATMFQKLVAKKPTYGAVVFDAPGKTFREERYPAYKADRPRMGEDLFVQLAWIDRVVAAHSYPMLRVVGYEADDVIGTLTKQARAAGHEVVIVSSDKDFAQLIGEGVRMLDTLRDVTYDAELVRKKWGVPPHQFVDYLALMGDKVDGVPGVPGIGKKGAAQLLHTYETLENLLDHAHELKGRKKTALSENRELALLCKELVTIDTAVPLEKGVEDLVLPEVTPDSLNELYKELEFYSLLSEEARDATADAGQRDYAVLTDPARLGEILSAAEGPVTWEPCLEGHGETPLHLAGLALCTQVGSAHYVPLSGPHAPESLAEGLAKSPAWAPLRDHFADPDSPKTIHDAKALWTALARQGLPLEGVAFDTRLASYLLEPTHLIPHRLGQVTKEFLHRTIRERKKVVGSGRKQVAWSAAPLELACQHACHRVDAVAELAPILEPQLTERGLGDHLHNHELPLGRVLGRMELDGILVDPERLQALGEGFKSELAELETKIFALAGRSFNVGSPKQLGTILFDELGLPVIKRTKTGYSTNQAVLERLRQEHPIAELLLEHRTVAKLINTYTDVLTRSARPDTHRIHTHFNHTSGATGRLITTDPDLQRTPVRGERGAQIRRCFVAPPGHTIVSADWSQIELRLMADASDDDVLVAAFREGRDVHALTAGELFGVAPSEVTKPQRDVGKTVNFATIYGQGATALSQILEISRKEAKAYIEGFKATYQGVQDWVENTTTEALESGYVTTLLGRRRYIPELSSNNKMIRQAGLRIAANTPLQGSGADICKLAMIEVDRRLRAEGLQTKLVLTIHDELLFEAPDEEVDVLCALAKEVMENVVELKVPLVVDVGSGDSWAAAH